MQLDAWINEGRRWLGRVRRADGRVSFIDQNDIRPVPDRDGVATNTRTTATGARPDARVRRWTLEPNGLLRFRLGGRPAGRVERNHSLHSMRRRTKARCQVVGSRSM